MPFSESHAKALLRVLPSRLETLLENRRYWDPTFLRVYLDHCDDVLFDHPRLGLEFAKIAPRLALLIPEKYPDEWRWASDSVKQEHRELVVRSYALLGGALRVVARFRDADRAYREAARYADSGVISQLWRANLGKRLAKLRSAQGRFAEALKLIEPAIEIYRKQGDQVCYADALNTRGYVLGEARRFSEATRCFSEALVLSKGTRKTSKLAKRTVASAALNLAAAVIQGCLPDDVVRALRLVKQAKRYQGKRRNTMNQYRLTWVEARIHARLGCGRTAERRLVPTRRKFFELGAPFEAALVGLELSLLYWQWAEWPKVEKLALETFEEFEALSSHTEGTAALRLWVEGARKRSLNDESIRAIQTRIQTFMAQGER